MMGRKMAASMDSRKQIATTISSWGANSYGQLATGNTKDEHQPKQLVVATGEIQQICGGGGHTAIITGTGGCLLCGNNNRGQLGIPSAACMLATTFQKLPMPHIISKIACGWEHTLALTDTGHVLTWGSNSHGQAGMADGTSSPSVIAGFSSHRVRDIAAGLRHSLALTTDGSVWSWGCGKKGQLGWAEDFKGGPPRSHLPKRVPLQSRGRCLAAGSLHSLVLTEDGRLFCWGDNKRGQLGIEPDSRDPYTLIIYEPREIVLNDVRIEEITSGWTHILILSDKGDVHSWGRNNYGQLGRPPGCCRNDSVRKICWQPAKILGLPSVKQISCGSEHSIALSELGEVYSWGWNEHGMCGDGTETDVFKPKKVEALDKAHVYRIGCGAGHTMVALR